jgi:hypothetical protein
VDWIREHQERIVNYPSTASHPLAGLRRGSKTVEKRHRVVRRTGAVVEVACSISAKPHCSDQRFCCVSEVGLCRIGISSGLVSNTAASMTDIELGQRGVGAGCHRPARGSDPADPNSGIFPLTGWPRAKERRHRQGAQGLPKLRARIASPGGNRRRGGPEARPDSKIAGLHF